MSRCGCSCEDCQPTDCTCAMGDSSCIAFTGSGSAANPFTAAPIIDPNPLNELTCGPDGLLAQTPSAIVCAPAVRARRNTNLTVPDAFQTTIPWEEASVSYPSGWWDAGDPTKLTVPEDGLYIVGLTVAWDTLANCGDCVPPGSVEVVTGVNFGAQTTTTTFITTCPGFGNLLIVKNASFVDGGVQAQLSCDGVTTQHAATMIALNAGDFLQATVSHTAGGNLDVLSDAFLCPEMWAARVRVDPSLCP